MFFRKRTLQTFIQDEMMKALVQHETRTVAQEFRAQVKETHNA